MKNDILDLSGDKALPLQLDAAISFRLFTDYLRKRVAGERTAKAGIYRNTLELFDKYQVSSKDIALADVHEYSELLEQLYVCLSPPLADENEMAWGLSFPFHPLIFYGTETLYQLMSNRVVDHEKYIVSKHRKNFTGAVCR
ncbi:hypothetical protein [Chitinophaga pinensis]|uniref:hypothetical protein n=1 Tax=Chitinophaga pinensis TaxID=79329 RepID=UPI001C994929|nr:hypothetical protein [Chitinophaga pinensis]